MNPVQLNCLQNLYQFVVKIAPLPYKRPSKKSSFKIYQFYEIDYFNKQIEELNISIQQYDYEIFRLSGLSSKAKSEREKLIKIVDLLKS